MAGRGGSKTFLPAFVFALKGNKYTAGDTLRKGYGT